MGIERGLLASLLLLAACARRDAEQEIDAARARAVAAVEALTSRLFGELSAALGAGPPEKALDVCGSKAQELTREIGASKGLSIRRTSLRWRNPANAPDACEERFLLAETARIAAGGAFRGDPQVSVEDLPGGGRELRLLKPIQVGGICVACHGGEGDLSEATRAAIRARYPDDRATGFRLNDLRGAVSVRVPLPE